MQNAYLKLFIKFIKNYFFEIRLSFNVLLNITYVIKTKNDKIYPIDTRGNAPDIYSKLEAMFRQFSKLHMWAK